MPPGVLATWCTFNEAFGGGRPKQQQPEPVTVTAVDERDSPGSPVFEELFLPPPPKPLSASDNKRNSSAGSCNCSGGHSAGVSCSSKSTPRSSPVPPPETVLYGTREAPVLERHCVEGGEFIIAWLSHSNPTTSSAALAPAAASAGEMQQQQQSSSVTTANTPGSGGGSSGGGAGGGPGGSRSFINKPARGWLHSDLVIVREGITYFVRVNMPLYLPALFDGRSIDSGGVANARAIDPWMEPP